MKSKINIVNKKLDLDTFNNVHTYSYEFRCPTAIEKHELMYGHKEELIEILTYNFEQPLREYLDSVIQKVK